jgi:spore germination protein YaaH
MTYRLADEEKIDETPVWYTLVSILSYHFFESITGSIVTRWISAKVWLKGHCTPL